MNGKRSSFFFLSMFVCGAVFAADDFPKPYRPPCVERENVFEFTNKPHCRYIGDDKYEITFAVKGYCDVTVAVVDPSRDVSGLGRGTVVRHLASGVLGANAPEPFQKNSLRQKIYWNGQDDLNAYHKEPRKLKIRVMLGLKPVFDKPLGPQNPKAMPGRIRGLAVNKEGAYVFSQSEPAYIRKFDLNGNYVGSLLPPPSGLPDSKLGGRTYIEYAPGQKAHHGPYLMEDLGDRGHTLPFHTSIFEKDIMVQAAVANGRLYYPCTRRARGNTYFSSLFHVLTDGATEVQGTIGRKLSDRIVFSRSFLAVSPDGKWLYLTGLAHGGVYGGREPDGAVYRLSADGEDEARALIGKYDAKTKQFVVGSDNESLHFPLGLDCDSAGRLYVADHRNNRLQVFSSDGKHVKTIPASGIQLVRVHKKTGAIYVSHKTTHQGRSISRLTKFASLDDPKPLLTLDHAQADVLELDSWSPTPRLWLVGGLGDDPKQGRPEMNNVVVLEETDAGFKVMSDFKAEARKSAGENWFGWSGSIFDHVTCDPVREQLYFRSFRDHPLVFDLKTGQKLRRVNLPNSNDIAFDKNGYLHVHLDPGFYMPGVVRLDPDQATPFRDHLGRVHEGLVRMNEVPYDYGVELFAQNKGRWLGGLPVKDQPGAKYFQDGMGVNMQGEVAVQSNIYHVPKMEKEGVDVALSGRFAKVARGHEPSVAYDGRNPYAEFRQYVEKREKEGELVYNVPRRPGIPLAGATVWTFDSTGEYKSSEPAVIANTLSIGVQIDESGFLYFANDAGLLIDGKVFLAQKTGNYGLERHVVLENATPVTYTVLKTRPKDVRWILKNAFIPLDPLPDRPTDLVGFGPFGPPQMGKGEMWVEGAEWLYAGLSPAVPAGCTCPATRIHLDWFKRVYLPEAYRRSIGILDTNGNLIMHLGRYGNLDDYLRTKPGATDIPITLPRFLSGTDNYFAFDDWGERLAVLRLDYETEITANINAD